MTSRLIIRSFRWVLAAGLSSATIARAATVGFNRDIQPILSEHCLTCHGQDEKPRKSELRLDERDLGFNVVENPVHVHDRHATLLHLLGFDHPKLTFRSQGRDFRLTDVHGQLVNGLLA